jgi:hypothetical protein
MDSMASQLWKFGRSAIAVAILAAGAAAVVWFLLAIIGVLPQLDPNVASAIVAAFAGLVVLVLGQIFNRNRQIAEAHRDKKVEVYAKFGQLLIDLQQATKQGKADELLKSDRVYNSIVDFNRDVLLWGSPSVIRAFLDYRVESNVTGPLVLVKMDRMLRAIRKDLGLSNWRLQQGDLVKLCLQDPTEFDKMLGR